VFIVNDDGVRRIHRLFERIGVLRCEMSSFGRVRADDLKAWMLTRSGVDFDSAQYISMGRSRYASGPGRGWTSWDVWDFALDVEHLFCRLC
jgi:hypothetical protein